MATPDLQPLRAALDPLDGAEPQPPGRAGRAAATDTAPDRAANMAADGATESAEGRQATRDTRRLGRARGNVHEAAESAREGAEPVRAIGLRVARAHGGMLRLHPGATAAACFRPEPPLAPAGAEPAPA